MKPIFLFEEGGKLVARDALGTIVPVELGGGTTPVPEPVGPAGIFYVTVPMPWSQGQGTAKQAIDYKDSKVVSQAYVLGDLVWLMHSCVVSNACAFALPEPPIEGGEWEWKLPWPTMARGYWTASAEIWNANHTHYLDGMIHLRTAIEDGLEVCYASIRVPQPAENKKGIVNKRGPWAEPWGNGFIYKFTLFYPAKR